MTIAKRTFDVCIAVVGLALLWPAFIVIALVIKAEDGGPAFFRHERVGYRGRSFRIWKFRSMRPNDPAEQPGITIANDPRITRAGAWLRRLKLDELPQLINVLNGDMSVVGPRPEVPEYVRGYTAEQRRVLDFRPGMTDPASIRYRNEEVILAAASDPWRTYLERVMPAKIGLNLAYGRRATIWSDLVVVGYTLGCLVGLGGSAGTEMGGQSPQGKAGHASERERR